MYAPSFPGFNQNAPPYAYGAAPQPQPPVQSDAGVETITSLLKHMDKEDLQKLLESDEKIMDMVNGCNELQQLRQEKLDTMTNNRSLADYNLSFKPRIEDGKRKLASLADEAATLKATFTTNLARLESLNSAANTDTLLSLLESASMESEEMSEQLLDALNAGSLGLAEFIQKYSEARQTYHMRKIKAEKLTELSNRQYAQPRQQQTQAAPSWNPAPQPPPPFAYGAPYQYQ